MTLEEALWQDDDRMSGAVCFRGTRIPVSILFDCLAGDGLDWFREGWPDVSEEQIQTVLDASLQLISKQVESKKAA